MGNSISRFPGFHNFEPLTTLSYLDKFGQENNYSVNVIAQEFMLGLSSKIAEGNPYHTAHSWRKEQTSSIIMDTFYDPFDENAKEFARTWTEQNDYEIAPGFFSDFDRR